MVKMQNIAGRFHKVYRDEKIIVIGFLGTASAYDLPDVQKEYILNFYNIKDYKNLKIIKNFDCLNNNHFNNYFYIEL